MRFSMHEAGAQEARAVLGLDYLEKQGMTPVELAARIAKATKGGVTPERLSRFEKNIERTNALGQAKGDAAGKALRSSRQGGVVTDADTYRKALKDAKGIDARQAQRRDAWMDVGEMAIPGRNTMLPDAPLSMRPTMVVPPPPRMPNANDVVRMPAPTPVHSVAPPPRVPNANDVVRMPAPTSVHSVAPPARPSVAPPAAAPAAAARPSVAPPAAAPATPPPAANTNMRNALLATGAIGGLGAAGYGGYSLLNNDQA